MEASKVLQHIDNTIVDQIEAGDNWEDILISLRQKSDRYRKRDAFIPVSERYLVNNWDRIEWKKRLTTMMVIQSLRRINDINWIIKNHSNFPQLESIQMYKIISLRDKLKYNKTA
jgi:hypothetical protein